MEYVLRRVCGKLYSINRLKPLTINVMKLLYQVHILPIIDYCDTVWMPTNTGHSKRLEEDFIHVFHQFTGSSMCNLTLAEHCRFHTAMQVYNILTKLLPSYAYHIQICNVCYRPYRVQFTSFVCVCHALKLWKA